MPEYPLLFFPTPDRVTRATLQGRGSNFHCPSHRRQGERLAPKFNQLQTSFTQNNVTIQNTSAGIDPEQVLVFETVGNVENFVKTVGKIDGFEWLGEIETNEIIPDDDFYAPSNNERNLSGRLYLMMSNQRAFDEMLSLWNRYQQDENTSWERGFAKYRDLFKCLKDVRCWGTQDRLQDTGILKYWEEEIETSDNSSTFFEIELWFRKDETRRRNSIESVANLVRGNSGTVHSIAEINAIQYVGMLVELPKQIIRNILANPDVALVKSDDIQFFRASGQMAVGRLPIEGTPEKINISEKPLPQGEPTIAVLDGMPLENHQLLANRLIVDDPDNFGTDYLAQDRKHGTTMASLIMHGDLSVPSVALSHPIYVRPIFQPTSWQTVQSQNSNTEETVPRNYLLVDLIHRSVRRLFETENGNVPVAPNVKIINLSIGDRSRSFDRFSSPLAKLLDWLSIKYNVLFIVSAGNQLVPIVFNCSEQQFRNLNSSDKATETVRMLYQDLRNRRLLSPAESINALTIGALHYDNSTINQYGRRVDLLENTLLPSPISAFGNGYRKSVKPDLIFNGGKQFYDFSPRSTETRAVADIRNSIGPPGIKAAFPSRNVGETDNAAYSCGTSNATVLISRAAGQCYDKLWDIINDNSVSINDSQIIALLKTMIVHGCSWGEINDKIRDILGVSGEDAKKAINRWLGYGVPQIQRVLDCTGQRVTLFGFGNINDGEADVFRLPLPTSLNGVRLERRLTVTLAWMSPIAPSTQKYRMAQLWFDVNNNEMVNQRNEAQWQMVKHGTVQHEIFVGENAVPYQSDAFLNIKVNCKSDTGILSAPVAYGLAVTLEVREETNIAIYNEVRSRLTPTVSVNV